MELILLFASFALIYGEPEESYCCSQGVLADEGNLCIDPVTNFTSPTKLQCQIVQIVPRIFIKHSFTDDGKMILHTDDFDTYIEPYRFCLANGTLALSQKVFMVCDEEEQKPILENSVFAYCLIVSAIFLAFTVIIYCALPEMRDLQGKSIISFCGSLAIKQIVLSILKFEYPFSNLGLCAARGFSVYFFLLASFFWMNAIAIQILLSIRRPSISDYRWKPYIWYALYSWGCPAVLTAIMAIVNYYPGKHPKPGIGLSRCWFFSNREQWQYLYSVMTVLILANLAIFVYISCHLWRHSFASSHIKSLKYKFMMTVRLVVIMGLSWIFEIISSLTTPHILWVITDFINVLQGVYIFLLFVVFRRRVIKALSRKGWLDCISGPVERYLAVGDDEEDVVQHTTDVGIDEMNK